MQALISSVNQKYTGIENYKPGNISNELQNSRPGFPLAFRILGFTGPEFTQTPELKTWQSTGLHNSQFH